MKATLPLFLPVLLLLAGSGLNAGDDGQPASIGEFRFDLGEAVTNPSLERTTDVNFNSAWSPVPGAVVTPLGNNRFTATLPPLAGDLYVFRLAGLPTAAPGSSFAEIASKAAVEAAALHPDFSFTFPTDDHYVAEFLYQNPDVCYWEVRTVDGVKRVVPVDAPPVPADAIALPAPSGGDDTATIEAALAANPGGTFAGSGTYRLDGLRIDEAGTVIHNMPSIPASASTGIMILLRAADIKLIDCPQDGQKQARFYLGVDARGADRFHLIRSGLTNMRHTQGKSGGGVFIRSCKNFHIACCRYENILSAEFEDDTCRSNAIWMNGFGGGNITDGGIIANNTAINLDSHGDPPNGNHDAEFFTTQSHDGHGAPVKLFANRCIDAGKRLVKAQQDGGVTALSNDYLWSTNESELGLRNRLAVIAVHFSVGDVIVQNNRIGVDGDKNWSYIMNVSGSGLNDNVRFDHNAIRIDNPWNGEGYDQLVLVGRDLSYSGSNTDSSQEPTNSSMNNNLIYGSGGVNFHYWMGEGFDLNSGTMETMGNIFTLGDPDSPHRGIERQK